MLRKSEGRKGKPKKSKGKEKQWSTLLMDNSKWWHGLSVQICLKLLNFANRQKKVVRIALFRIGVLWITRGGGGGDWVPPTHWAATDPGTGVAWGVGEHGIFQMMIFWVWSFQFSEVAVIDEERLPDPEWSMGHPTEQRAEAGERVPRRAGCTLVLCHQIQSIRRVRFDCTPT